MSDWNLSSIGQSYDLCPLVAMSLRSQAESDDPEPGVVSTTVLTLARSGMDCVADSVVW